MEGEVISEHMVSHVSDPLLRADDVPMIRVRKRAFPQTASFF